MNRVVLESSPVQHMMAENPNLWNINNMRPPSQQSSPFFPPTVFLPQHTMPNSSLSMSSWHEIQELPVSWSQLLMGGVAAEEDKRIMNPFLPKKFESNWEEQLIHQGSTSSILHDVKPENSAGSYGYGHHASDEFQAVKSTWSPMIPVSSPQSCVTSLSGNNMLDFSGKKACGKHPHPDKSSECNSTATGGAAKKARVQSSSQSTFKVRKEKLGDRVTALHQLVSPFGKTDTASVLLEAIGYIRFLQSQIEALSLPYLNSGPVNIGQTQPAQGDRNCIFPEDPGQLLNDNCLKRKGVSQQEGIEEPKNDLRSRGLCVVPISCTMQVGGDNGADYCAPAFGGEFRHI